MQRIIKSINVFTDVKAHLSDDFMNLIDVAAARGSGDDLELFGVLFLNKHCYLATPFAADLSDNAPILRRTLELK
jgi:hypothetical protein